MEFSASMGFACTDSLASPSEAAHLRLVCGGARVPDGSSLGGRITCSAARSASCSSGSSTTPTLSFGRINEIVGTASTGICATASRNSAGCTGIREKSHDGPPLGAASASGYLCPNGRSTAWFPAVRCRISRACSAYTGLSEAFRGRVKPTSVEWSDDLSGLCIRPARCIRPSSSKNSDGTELTIQDPPEQRDLYL